MKRLIMLMTLVLGLSFVTPAYAQDKETVTVTGELEAKHDADGKLMHYTLTDADGIVYHLSSEDPDAWHSHLGTTITLDGLVVKHGEDLGLHVHEDAIAKLTPVPEAISVSGKVVAVMDADGDITHYTFVSGSDTYMLDGNDVIVAAEHENETLSITGVVRMDGENRILVVETFTQQAVN